MARSRKGPRPHVWKVKGEIPHKQHIAWLRMKAQCKFREEPFELSLEQFQQLWEGKWHLRGRGNEDLCMARQDPLGAWDIDNTQVVTRVEHLRRQGLFRRCKEIRESQK